MDSCNSVNELEKKWKTFLFMNSGFPASKEKMDALDDYLTSLMDSLSDSDIIQSQQQFRDCIGAAGILTRCFLDDVAQLCENSTDQLCLLNYLYSGRGCRLLRSLEMIGVGAITCNFELTELLLSLLPFLRNQALQANVVVNSAAGLNRFETAAEEIDELKAAESSISTSITVETQTMEPMEMEDPDLNDVSSSTNALDSIFNLLQQLCQADVEDCSSMPFSNNASYTVLSVLTQQLMSIAKIHKQVSVSYSYITQKMISLLVSIGMSLLKYKEPLTRLPTISSSLKQFLCYRLQEINSLSNTNELLLDDIMSCTLGIVDILHSASSIINNALVYNDYLQVFHLFLNSEGCDILTKSISYLLTSSRSASQHEALSRLITTLGQVGMNTKKLRIESRQFQMKDRSPTKRWRLDVTSHHHYCPSESGDEREPCPVGTVTKLLMSLVGQCGAPEEEDELISSAVLNALTKCGICCCVDLAQVYSVMFANVTRLSRNLQEHRFRFIEVSVISLSGFQVLFERTVATCESCRTRIQTGERTLEEVYLSLTSTKSMNILDSYPPFLNGYWNVFDKYKEILTTSSAPSLILLMEKHLLSIVTGVNSAAVQMELFFRVILPLLVRHSYEGEDEMVILRSMLNVVLAFADVPEINRTLHVINIMENLYRVMCSPKLRDVVLRLLHTLASVTWINNLDDIYLDNDECHVNSEEMNVVLNIYHDILVQHTVCYQNLLVKSEVLTNGDNSCCVSGDLIHSDSDGSLLLCLRDLWRTMSCIADRCVERRQWLWDKSLKPLVLEFTVALAKRNWSNEQHQLEDEVEWEILGILIHLIVTCQVSDPVVIGQSKEATIVERLRYVFKFSPQENSVVNFSPNVDRLFQMLAMASLETNRLTLEFSKRPYNTSNTAKRLCETPVDNLSGNEVEDGSADSVSSTPYLTSLECDYDADVEDNDTFLAKGEFQMAKLYKAEPWVEDATKITCPSVLNLALQLVVEYKSWMKVEEKYSESRYWNPVENLMQTLGWICKYSSSNCHLLLKNCQITSVILREFYDVLISPDLHCFHSLQTALLDLFSSCLRDGVSDWELKTFLKLFMRNQSLSSKLLQCLNSILNTVKPEPPNSVTFLHSKFVDYTLVNNNGNHVYGNSGRSFNGVDLESCGGHDTGHKDEETLTMLETVAIHRKMHSVNSSWAVASLAGWFPAFTNLGELPFGDGGLAVSLWLLLPVEHHSNYSARHQLRKIHLFTCTYDRLAIEFWVHLDTKLLIIKLISWSRETHQILDTKLSTNPLTVNSWQHLFFTWVPFVKESNLILLVNVCENAASGKPVEQISLECEWRGQQQSKKRHHKWCLLMGHSGVQEETRLAWRLGQLKMFRGSFVNSEAAVLLNRLGPGNTQLQIFQIGVVDPSIVPPNLQPTDNSMVNLRNKLLLSYLPQNPAVFIWHSSVFIGESSRSTTGGAAAADDVLVNAVKLGHLQPTRNCSLHVALTRVGGAVVFISLFGLMVVQHPLDEDLQTDCLQLLVDLIRRDDKMKRHFVDCSGWELILWVMSTSKCKISCRMLAILLKECTSDPVLIYDLSDQKWTINKASAATVVNPNLLSLLLCNWKMWNDRCKEILHWLLRCCVFLVDGSHPKREYNLKVFAEINMMEIIFDMLRERCFGDTQTTLSSASSRCVVRLLEILCGKRATLDCLSKFVDCLIAIHPFKLTYVCHARASFYFLLEKLPGKKSSVKSTQSVPGSSKYDKKMANEQLMKQSRDQKSENVTVSTLDKQIGPNLLDQTDHVEAQDISASKSTGSFITCQDNTSVPYPSESESENSLKSAQDSFEGRSATKDVVEGAKVSLYASGSSASTVKSDKSSSSENSSLKRMANLRAMSVSQQKHVNSEDVSDFTDLGIIAKGLLSVIANTMIEADMHSFHDIAKIVDCKLLVVLALHPHEGVRAEVVKTLKIYFSKMNDDRSLDSFKKQNIFIALANQLYQYKVEMPMAEACIEFTLGEIFSFQACSKILPFHYHIDEPCGIPLLLSILPRLSHNAELCQNFITTLNHLCRVQPDLFFLLFDYGLVQSVCVAISSVIHSNYSSVLEEDWQVDPSLNCLNDFLTDATYHYLWFGNANRFANFAETLCIIAHYEDLEIQRYGIALQYHLALRNCLCKCMLTALVTMLVHFDWNEDAVEYCCKAPYLSTVITRSYPLPSKLPTDLDLQNRFGEVVCYSVNHLLRAGSYQNEVIVSDLESWLCQFVMHVLLEGAVTSMSKTQWSFQIQWTKLVNMLRPCFHYHFLEMLTFVLSPSQTLYLRLKIVDHLISTQSHIDTLLCLLKENFQCRQQVVTYLDLLLNDVDHLKDDEIAKCLTLQMELQKEFNYSVSNVIEMSKIVKMNSSKWVCPVPTINKLLEKLETRFREVVKIADQATAMATKKQDEQMKLFHALMKKKFSERLYIRQKWQSLVNRLTHERAVWYHPESYPVSWQLDSTEGPQRVRKRLKKCSLVMEERFLQPNAREKLKLSRNVHPFQQLFEDENVSDDHAVLNNNIQTKEKISLASNCSIITPYSESGGEILFGTNCIYYIGEEIKNQLINSQIPVKNDVICHCWKFDDIKEIHKRRYQLQDSALEIFLSYGQTFLLAFTATQGRNAIYDRLMAFELPNLVPETETIDIHTQMWRDGAITNFEYVTQLNKFAGRSFNDLMQYPVFPFILADYVSPVLDLTNGDTFRNLSKPMAIQKKNRESHYLNQYSFLQKEQEESGSCVVPTVGPYHYGSHYSNSGIVLHFLVRLPPFTNMFLHYQDNNFDIPDRTFHSVQTSWRLASSDSTTDVKELIPEFYFLPEMFLNGEGYDFGVRQTGERVENVEIPVWARGDPRLFTLIHRQSLETPFVTQHLHHWIDLVFGYKQTGKAAVEAMNVFHPATYFGFDINQMKDPLRMDAMKTMIRTFGQTPIQLFKRSHPLVSLTLSPQSPPPCIKRVMEEVVGLNWGKYVGSPCEPEPVEIFRKCHSQPIGSFVSMVTNEVFGLAPKTALLVQYCKDKGVSLINTTYITSAALIRWGHHDGLIRIQFRRDSQSQSFAAIDVADPVTCCATSPDCMFIFFGKSSGNIVVYHYLFDSMTSGSQTWVKWDKITHLYGHDAEVTAIHLCKEFSISVSASADSTCIIWDLNRLKYIRCIEDHKSRVKLISVSDTSGDIATVSHSTDEGSVLILHTINAKQIGQVKSKEKIHSVCFSCANEGLAVNVICAGLENGTVMMWSTWDLTPVRMIKIPKFHLPILCITYSLDCQHLYLSNEAGVLIILETSACSSLVPKFRTII